METKQTKTPVDCYVGLGGAGGWLVTLRLKSVGNSLIIIDGDVVTESNLSRQFFDNADIGHPKVEGMERALKAARVNVKAFAEYLARDSKSFKHLLELPNPLRLFCAPDNHPCRRLCLELADERLAAGYHTVVVLPANETRTASADVYLPQWQGQDADYRVRYPEVQTDNDGDPLSPPCTGEALASKPQLSIANSLAALSAAWLMDVWTKELPALAGDELYRAIRDKAPISVQWVETSQRTVSLAELRKET